MKSLNKLNTYWITLLASGIFTFQACAAGAVTTGNDIVPESAGNMFIPGQCDSLGPDTNKTLDYLSLYMEFYSHEDYKEAIPYWRYVYRNAPGFHDAVYSNGIKMYKAFIDTTPEGPVREALIDTLFSIYDKRIECFGRRGYNLGRKAYDMMKYRPTDVPAIRELLNESIAASGTEAEYFLLEPYIRLNARLYLRKELSREDMLAKYAEVANIVEVNKNSRYGQYYTQSMDRIVAYLTEIGLLNCTTLVPFYSEAYTKNPDNQELWEKAFNTLKGCNNCNDTIVEMFARFFEATSSPAVAIKLADCYVDAGKTGKGIFYIDKAIETLEDPEQKADLAYKAALIYYAKVKNFPKAREYCYKALKYRPDWGKPYLLIGNLYASSGKLCGPGTGWESQVVIWPAMDKWIKAKTVDPSVADEANKQIKKYHQYMPKFEEIFARGYQLGATYKVNCWIQETTTIRASDK